MLCVCSTLDHAECTRQEILPTIVWRKKFFLDYKWPVAFSLLCVHSINIAGLISMNTQDEKGNAMQAQWFMTQVNIPCFPPKKCFKTFVNTSLCFIFTLKAHSIMTPASFWREIKRIPCHPLSRWRHEPGDPAKVKDSVSIPCYYSCTVLTLNRMWNKLSFLRV